MFFNWVKAHVGIQGNEMADRLTKKAETDDKGGISVRYITKTDYNYGREGERKKKMAGAFNKL